MQHWRRRKMELGGNIGSDWSMVKLGEICEKAAKIKRKEVIPDEKLIYLDIGGIDNQSNRIADYKTYYWKDAPSRAQQIVKVGDTLFSTFRTYLKNIARVDNSQFDNQICSSGFTVIRAINRLADSKFLFILSLSEGFLQPLNKLQTGTSYPAVRDNDVFGQIIPLPPLPEQRAIVSKIEQLFSDLDNGIENFKKAQEQLKIYHQSVLKAACEGRLVPNEAELARAEGRDYEPANVLLARILKERREKWNGKGKYKEPAAPDVNGLDELPEGWGWTRIDEIISKSQIGLVRSASEQNTESSSIPYIKMNNITIDGKVLLYDLVKVQVTDEELARYSIQEGDILFNTRNSVELVGKTGIVRGYVKEIVYNNNLMRIQIVNEVSSQFAAYQMCSPDFRNRMEMIKKSTTNVAAIYAKDLVILPFLLPPLVEQRRIVAEVERRLSFCDKMEETITESLKKAEALRQSILKKAFEGKLLNEKELEEAYNALDWEPVEKLLERIKAEKMNIKTKNNGKK